MAVDEILDAAESPEASQSTRRRAAEKAPEPWKLLLMPIASLKLTVALFAMGIFITFVGTLAQMYYDLYVVLQDYFYAPLAKVELRLFFPSDWGVRGWFYFPGGASIGLLMFLNLAAAHLLRFQIQAKGTRLVYGLIATSIGVLATWMAIASGFNEEGIQDEPILDWDRMWQVFNWSLYGILAALAYALTRVDSKRRVEFWGLASIVAVLGAILAWIYIGDVSLSASSMRILWQLTHGGTAALVLLLGLAFLFRKRAGVVMIHLGIALLMFSEFLVSMLAVEGQMSIAEGETVNFARDIRSVELAVVDPSDPEQDAVTAIPESILLDQHVVSDPRLPFDVRRVDYFGNATLEKISESDPNNPATAGHGLNYKAVAARESTGTDMGAVDTAAGYFEFLDKQTGASLGVYLCGVFFSIQDVATKVPVDDKTYEVFLRFKRDYKPYSIALRDVRFDKYIGTEKAKNYSSDIRLVDPERNEDRDVRIWMNNPLRYAGETFYQSEYKVDPVTGKEMTVLQVVSNTGWMIPYVSCMLVAVGMLAHFGIALTRFLNRRSRGAVAPGEISLAAAQAGKMSKKQPLGDSDWWGKYSLPLILVTIFTGYFLSKARPALDEPGEMQIHRFGKLPVVYQGRIKPLDTLARNSLRVISDRQTFVDEDGNRQPAIRWLLDVISGSEAARKHRVFRIPNLELLDTLGLERRKGYRYSLAEIWGSIEKFEAQEKAAGELDPRERSFYQNKVLELGRKLRLFITLHEVHAMPNIRRDHMREDLQAAVMRHQQLAKSPLPLIVPPPEAEQADEPEQAEKGAAAGEAPPVEQEQKWQPLMESATEAYVMSILGQQPREVVRLLLGILVAYNDGNVQQFNSALEQYENWLAENRPANVDPAKNRFEAMFNNFSPFSTCAVVYVVAFVISCVGLLIWPQLMGRTAFWLLALTLVVHTLAIASRIYISGRPPVTNLYSSAVFIGWGCVGLGLIFESIYKMGIGNLVASVSGFLTLLVAHFLAGDGDTFEVLQAVLDTQFWLATHVTSITLGYSTTFLAGFMGIAYVLLGLFTPALDSNASKSLARMIYGVICFAIFFSFVGTVLGGLWADDSWGRFWGWDPKENGALIIVLWNALVLHARWDGMIRDRGLAVLAIGGNIVTSWSWFGVNELGAGLHSYGFTEGTAYWLLVFAGSQLGLIALGCIPKKYWASGQHGALS